jgi:hypothetical protein
MHLIALASIVQIGLPGDRAVLTTAEAYANASAACQVRQPWHDVLHDQQSAVASGYNEIELVVPWNTHVNFSFVSDALDYHSLYVFEIDPGASLEEALQDTCQDSSVMLAPQNYALFGGSAVPHGVNASGFQLWLYTQFDRPGAFLVVCAASLYGVAVGYCALPLTTPDWTNACIAAFENCVRGDDLSQCVATWSAVGAVLSQGNLTNAISFTAEGLALASHCSLSRHRQIVRVQPIDCDTSCADAKAFYRAQGCCAR